MALVVRPLQSSGAGATFGPGATSALITADKGALAGVAATGADAAGTEAIGGVGAALALGALDSVAALAALAGTGATTAGASGWAKANGQQSHGINALATQKKN